MIKINELATYRYSITTMPNEKEIYKLFNFAGLGTQNVTMSTTYKNLINQHFKTLAGNGHLVLSEQVKRNHLTALRAFIAYAGQSESSPVGLELTGEFSETLKSHLSVSNLSKRSQTDRRSLLNSWRDSFLAMGVEPARKSSRERRRAADTPLEQNPFEKMLWDSLKSSKLAPKSAARLAEISTSAVGRWSRGALPNERSTDSLRRLDKVLCLTPGTLLNSFHEATGRSSTGPAIEYRERQKVNSSQRYRVGADDIRPSLLDEWQAHLLFKTASDIRNLIRPNNTRWSIHEERYSSTKPSVFTSTTKGVSPSAGILWNRTSSFLGYLRLPVASGGFGLNDEVAQTLAWFAVPEAIEGYFDFVTERSDGLKHGSQEGFCASVIALLHPQHGYLSQCPNFANKLPASVTNFRNWEELCNSARATAKSLKSECLDKSRKPDEPIRALLSLEQPLTPIFAAMRKLRVIGDASTAGSSQEAVARRNELLLGILISNPLRSKNIITLTHKSNNTGDLYRDVKGKWRIRISVSRMKNRKRLKNKDYDAPLPAWLFPLIDDYISKFRQILSAGKKSEYLFLSNNGNKFNSMNKQIFKLTKTLIPNCSGFGPHAIRHLVATDWLKKHPNDFSTVSELLNDTIEVIMNNYFHLKIDIAFGRYELYVQEILPGGVY